MKLLIPDLNLKFEIIYSYYEVKFSSRLPLVAYCNFFVANIIEGIRMVEKQI